MTLFTGDGNGRRVAAVNWLMRVCGLSIQRRMESDLLSVRENAGVRYRQRIGFCHRNLKKDCRLGEKKLQ